MIAFIRKICKTAAMSAASYVGDSPLFVLDYLLRLLRVMVLVSLWRALFRHPHQLGTDSSALTLPALLTYTFIAEAFSEPLNASTDVAWSFWDGSITTRFIKPLGIFTQFIAETCGKWAFNMAVFSLPLLVLGLIMGVHLQPVSWSAGLLFLVSMIFGIAVGFALDFLFTSFAISLQFPPFALERVRTAIASLLSGAFIPLGLLPWGLGQFFGWLPFASVASAPLRIYTGSGDTLNLLGLQALWALTLWPLTIWQWRKNQEKMVAYGG